LDNVLNVGLLIWTIIADNRDILLLMLCKYRLNKRSCQGIMLIVIYTQNLIVFNTLIVSEL